MDYEVIVSLLTLVALEAVLGIDNIIFIAILANKLPQHKQKKARRYGLLLAAILRIGLLAVISFILQLDEDLFEIFNKGFSVKELILIAGGLFLLYKSAKEVYHKMEGEEGDRSKKIKVTSFANVVFQILIMDLVFSIDSIITAVGIAKEIWVMYASVIASVALMLVASGPISRFVNRHPAFKMLALCFLLLIGFTLIGEGFGYEIPKGYVYFSMAFAFLVDVVQMRMNRKKQTPPVDTREHYSNEEENLPKDIL
ncbi:MAG: Integral rane protein TerC [Bacteroidetes bacterium]|nr:Integral rane protein TerC [Bacteroidota bacterium]